ncbi:364_t:CDS:2, partial [Gigaspora rosea]
CPINHTHFVSICLSNMPYNNERYPLSHEFLSIANILNKICFGELKSIEFGNGLLTVKRLISDDTNYEKMLENAITRIMELEDEIKLLRTIFKKSTYKKIM